MTEKQITNLMIVADEGVLADDEYYALMVVDYLSNLTRNDWFDKKNRWVGWECTSKQEIYISKRRSKRECLTSDRGLTFRVKVKNSESCYILTKV